MFISCYESEAKGWLKQPNPPPHGFSSPFSDPFSYAASLPSGPLPPWLFCHSVLTSGQILLYAHIAAALSQSHRPNVFPWASYVLLRSEELSLFHVPNPLILPAPSGLKSLSNVLPSAFLRDSPMASRPTGGRRSKLKFGVWALPRSTMPPPPANRPIHAPAGSRAVHRENRPGGLSRPDWVCALL